MFDRTCFELTPQAKAGTELSSTNLANIDWGRIASSPAKYSLIYSLPISAIHAPDPKERRWEKLLRETSRREHVLRSLFLTAKCNSKLRWRRTHTNLLISTCVLP
jgi:hypothetical protein